MILYSGLYFSLSEQWKFARETNEFEAKSKFTFIMHANGVREFSFKFRAKRDKANQILTQLPKSPFTEKKQA